MADRFDFAWDPTYRRIALPFGATPRNAWVDVDDEWVDARFGLWRMRIAHLNIADVAITGPYAMVKTAGPARLGITDAGLTFATNGDRGVLLTFRTKLRSRGPLWFLQHPELTVTVADVEGFAARVRDAAGLDPG